MSENHFGSEYDISAGELTSNEAKEYVALQEMICEMLDENPRLTAAQVPPEMQTEVRMHILTCQDRVHSVDGIVTDTE